MNKKTIFLLLFLFLLLNITIKTYSATTVSIQDRYKLISHKGEMFLLDTWSGRVWTMVYDKAKKENWFKELVVFDNENSIPFLRIMSDVKKRIIENNKLKKKKTNKKKKWLEEITGSSSKKK
jgi:hypothetical protein